MASGGAWLRCKVGKGVFSKEAMVVIEIGGKELALFVPIDNVYPQPVANKEIDGRVRVSIEKGKGGMWATIPTPQPATVPIQQTDLVDAA